jgi:hypothetical protein
VTPAVLAPVARVALQARVARRVLQARAALRVPQARRVLLERPAPQARRVPLPRMPVPTQADPIGGGEAGSTCLTLSKKAAFQRTPGRAGRWAFPELQPRRGLGGVGFTS